MSHFLEDLSFQFMYIYTVPLYGELQHDNSIRILDETIKASMEKADALKVASVSLPIWSSPHQKWPSHLAEKVKMSSDTSNISRAKYISFV